MEDKDNIYIGRKGIVFIEKYRKYLIKMLENEDFRKEFIKLKGKNLGCWCSPEKYHGDVIMDVLNEMSDKNT